ncbi:MAG: metalloregulator ArsR/SmtB family transcription factor [Thermodesulfobacteriota bacterium]
MELYIKVMKALSDPTRAKMLKILQVKELCVCELRSLLGFAQPTISRHLKVLEDAGLVESYKEKMWVHYRLAADTGNVYAMTALANLHGWFADNPEIKSLHENIPAMSRDDVVHQESAPDCTQPDKQVKTYFYPINKLTKDK